MKKSFPRLDFRLIIPVVFLVLISLTILYSINPAYLQNQLFALSIAVIAFFLFSQISYTDFRNLKIPLYVASITLLGIVFLLGFESRGAIRWVEVFGVSLQASEIAKPMISLSFAGLLASYSNKNLKVYILSFLSLIPIFVLIYLQPDLGNALLFVMVAIFSLLIYGMPLSWVVLGAIPFIISSPFVWEKLHDYQRLRVLTFVNPLLGPSDNCSRFRWCIREGDFRGHSIAIKVSSRKSHRFYFCIFSRKAWLLRLITCRSIIYFSIFPHLSDIHKD